MFRHSTEALDFPNSPPTGPDSAYRVLSPRHGHVLAADVGRQSLDSDAGQERVGVDSDVHGVRDGDLVARALGRVGAVLAYGADDGVKRSGNRAALFLFLDVLVVADRAAELRVRDHLVQGIGFKDCKQGGNKKKIFKNSLINLGGNNVPKLADTKKIKIYINRFVRVRSQLINIFGE